VSDALLEKEGDSDVKRMQSPPPAKRGRAKASKGKKGGVCPRSFLVFRVILCDTDKKIRFHEGKANYSASRYWAGREVGTFFKHKEGLL